MLVTKSLYSCVSSYRYEFTYSLKLNLTSFISSTKLNNLTERGDNLVEEGTWNHMTSHMIHHMTHQMKWNEKGRQSGYDGRWNLRSTTLRKWTIPKICVWRWRPTQFYSMMIWNSFFLFNADPNIWLWNSLLRLISRTHKKCWNVLNNSYDC